MPTIKQRKLAKRIVENLTTNTTETAGEMLEKVGYAKSVAEAKPGEILDSEGVQEALEEYGFTEENAKMVVSEIMLNGDVEANARLKATDQVFKVKGSYVADKNGGNKTLVVMISGESAKRFNIQTE